MITSPPLINIKAIVTSDDVRNYNSFDNPEIICDMHFDATLPNITLPPHSVVRIVFEK